MHKSPREAHRPCNRGAQCFDPDCPFLHGTERKICPRGAKCQDIHLCSDGIHPPVCIHGHYCPHKNSSCRYVHLKEKYQRAPTGDERRGLIILVELDCLLAYYGRFTNEIVCRPGAAEFISWLKLQCRRYTCVRAAFYSHLPHHKATCLAKRVDSDNSLFIYSRKFNRPDASVNETESMRDFPAVWNFQRGPAWGCDKTTTIMLDNNCRRVREYPNNFVYIPPFGTNGVMDDADFQFSQVCEYLGAVLQESHKRKRRGDIRSALYRYLSPQLRRENKLLILLDLNGTLVYRSLIRLKTENPFFRHSSNPKRYYFRQNAKEFISNLLKKRRSCDCIELAFYSSMTQKNACAVASKLDSFSEMYVYGREYNMPDLLCGDDHAVIRNLPAIWSNPDGPGFGYSERSTIMVDDTVRKMREYPRNLVQVFIIC